MSLILDLKKEIQETEEVVNIFETAIRRSRLFEDILSGVHGTKIMLDYLDYLGGNSVEFVREQQEKGMDNS